MTPRQRTAAVAASLCLTAGLVLMLAGFGFHRLALAFLGAVFTGAAFGSAAVDAYLLLRWHRTHGSEVCYVYRLRLRGRVRHLHWPKASRADCLRPVGFHACLRQRAE